MSLYMHCVCIDAWDGIGDYFSCHCCWIYYYWLNDKYNNFLLELTLLRGCWSQLWYVCISMACQFVGMWALFFTWTCVTCCLHWHPNWYGIYIAVWQTKSFNQWCTSQAPAFTLVTWLINNMWLPWNGSPAATVSSLILKSMRCSLSIWWEGMVTLAVTLSRPNGWISQTCLHWQ